MLKKILIANRGEIALRILRTCKELKIKTVTIYSKEDKNIFFNKLSDEAILINSQNCEKDYDNIKIIIEIAKKTNSDAIHPGYGFLSENADFAEQVEKNNIIFIGPSSNTIRKLGNKISAINIMKKMGSNCIPNLTTKIEINNKIIKTIEKLKYPLLLKNEEEGGGKEIYKIKNRNDLIKIINTKNKKKIYIEKMIKNARHIEIQIMGDGLNKYICLGTRECSIQRNNQKILEEAPAKILPKEIYEKTLKICLKICKKFKYKGLGTFEFLYKNKKMYFLEINPRIQVEHPVTEMVTGLDIIKEHLNMIINKKLTIKQKNIKINGHSIECRINAENYKTFHPSPGKINFFHQPGGQGIRMDTHIYTKYEIPTKYDSLIGKLIVHSDTRKNAIEKMKNALNEIIIDGIETNIKLHKLIFNHINFKKNKININYIKKLLNNH